METHPPLSKSPMTPDEKLSHAEECFPKAKEISAEGYSFVNVAGDNTEESSSTTDYDEIADELDEFDNAITTRVKQSLSDSVPAERLEVCRALETLAGLDTNTELSKRVSTAAEEHEIVYCQETLYDVAYWYYNE
jgi:hypothetical protein